MADTTNFTKVIEPWFRENYLKEKYPNAEIRQEKVALIWGGKFEYDAVVYEEGKLKAIYLLSCSEYRTQNGKGGAGKFHKIKSDILMMVGTEAPKKVMAFLGESMHRQFEAQKQAGRLPQDIQCELVKASPEITKLVIDIRNKAASEVTPTK